jgi:hypothetical protein
VLIVVIGVVITTTGLVVWLAGIGGTAPSTLEVTPLGLTLETSALAILVMGLGIITSLFGFALLARVDKRSKIALVLHVPTNPSLGSGTANLPWQDLADAPQIDTFETPDSSLDDLDFDTYQIDDYRPDRDDLSFWIDRLPIDSGDF